MTINICELKKQIAEKNNILNSVSINDKKSLEKKRITNIELDKLLYLYFKALTSTNNNVICY